MAVKPLAPEPVIIWSARVAVLVAALCAVLALITGLTGTRIVAAASSTLLLAGVGAMLYGVWAVLMALYLFGIRTR